MPIRHEKGVPGESFGLSERVVMGPDAFQASDQRCKFDEPVWLDKDEVAVCYMDPDYIHQQAHWVIGLVPEVVQWLMDEAAASPRKRALITMISLRLLAVSAGLQPEHMRAFEQGIAVAVEREVQ